VLEDRLV